MIMSSLVRLLGLVLALAIAAAISSQLPDIKRYLKIRAM